MSDYDAVRGELVGISAILGAGISVTRAAQMESEKDSLSESLRIDYRENGVEIIRSLSF